MIKRIIEISRNPAHLSVRLDQLIVQPTDSDKSESRSFPCEDIGFLVIDHPQVTMSLRSLSTLMDFGAAVIVCGHDHLPNGFLLPISSHTEVVWRLNDQINASEPTKKRLWRQIIVAKIRAQAAALAEDSPGRGYLLELAKEVKSGDSTNVEGHAAKIYWSQWLGPTPIFSDLPVRRTDADPPTPEDVQSPAQPPRFSRDQDGTDMLNIHLNYGYAVLRAGVARALVSAGLFPALGMHHHNRSNAFVLADDLMEPFRPMIDIRVRKLHQQSRMELDQLNKAALLGTLQATVTLDGQGGPLMVALHRYAASLARCLRGEADQLQIPTPE